MKAYVGVTDTRRYQFLAARPHLDEVNFWRPGGGRRFGALTPGEPFLFKTHYPHNQVVGGGFYSDFAPLRVSEAWEFFGEENGVEGLQEMRTRVGRYRAEPITPDEDPMIGCVFVRDTRFFAPEDAAGPPPDFAANIVQGKTYDLATPSTASYFEQVMRRLLDAPTNSDDVQPWHRPGPVYGDPRLTPYRLWANTRFKRRCWTPTPAAARSLETRSGRCSKRRTSVRCQQAGSIAWTTAYCSGLTCTPSSTVDISGSTRSTACWSARCYARNSEMASSSTPAPGRR